MSTFHSVQEAGELELGKRLERESSQGWAVY